MARKPIINRELADSFRSMVGFAAWKHLDKFMTVLVEDAVKSEDAESLTTLTVAKIGEVRGIRQAVNAIRDEVGQYLKEA